jgi:hypothetical protein
VSAAGHPTYLQLIRYQPSHGIADSGCLALLLLLFLLLLLLRQLWLCLLLVLGLLQRWQVLHKG